MRTRFRWPVVCFALAACGPTPGRATGPSLESEPSVVLARVPDGGLQPDVAVDAAGVVHMVYLAGEPAAADVFYSRSLDAGRTFSPAVRVNGDPGSAIAAGTIRGAQLAVGRGGRVHVIWNGPAGARPEPPANPRTTRPGMPMLYARSDAAGTSFEPQRNLMTITTTLDGGGSIAADAAGGVFAAWHANALDGRDGEDARRVWISRSANDGETFAGEAPVSDPATGVCGCCALRLFTDAHGALHLMYRSATDVVHRDIYALVSRDAGRTFSGGPVHAWEIGACPMTSMAMAEAGRIWRAWETDGQVYFQALDSAEPPLAPPPGASAGDSGSRKHPRLAALPDGRLLLAWAEGTGWARGGSIAWQVFDSTGRPLGTGGRQADLPAWSFPAVVARPDGGFTILY